MLQHLPNTHKALASIHSTVKQNGAEDWLVGKCLPYEHQNPSLMPRTHVKTQTAYLAKL